MENHQIAIDIFRRIQEEFPEYKMELDDIEHPYVECSLQIPIQHGLRVPFCLSLQNSDELHLQVGEHLLIEWFPCEYPEKVDAYYNAVHGLLTDDYRILVFRRWGRTEKSHLQIHQNGNWKTIGRYWRYFYVPFLPFGFQSEVLTIK